MISENFIRSSALPRTVARALLLSAVFFSLTGWAGPSRYHAIVLPQLDPVSTVDVPARMIGRGLDDKGIVVGEFGFPPQRFLWSTRRGIISLKELAGWDDALPQGVTINAMVGLIVAPGEASSAFFVRCGEQLKRLPKLNDEACLAASATAVSPSGVVVGWCETRLPASPSEISRRAVIWRDGVVTDLGAPAENNAEAAAVNRAGVVAGALLESSGRPARAFRWSGTGGLEMLPPLSEKGSTGAFALNDAGLIAGFAESVAPGGGSVRHAALWSRENQLSILPYVSFAKSGSNSAEALAINNRGQVVGFQRNVTETRIHAVLWEAGLGYALRDLIDNLPDGTRLESAVAINDRGEILVNGFNQVKPQFITALLTPVIATSAVAGSIGAQSKGGSTRGDDFKK